MSRFLRCGREAVLVEVSDLNAALTLYDAVSSARLRGVVDLVPAARTLLIRLDPSVTSPTVVRTQVAALPLAERRTGGVETIEIDVRYNGPDLDEIAILLAVSPREIVSMHTKTAWTVAFVGFAPGFAYLVGGDPRLTVPRRADPRVRIPAGSVGLAGAFSGIYPTESPGGWQLIGSTTQRMWDQDRSPPALLVPGTEVCFREVSS